MTTYLVYQFSAYRDVYRLVAQVPAASPAAAAYRVRLATFIVGALYVRTKDDADDAPPREVPARGRYAATLAPC
jgi:hypothetical protein